MSGQALVWAANIRGLPPATKIVLIQLAERHNKDTGRCDPKIVKLAEDCEMHRATVLRHLVILEEMGLLTRVSQGAEGGGRASSQYDLHTEKTAPDEQRSQFATGGKGRNSGGQRSQIEQAKVAPVRPPYIDEPVLNLKEPNAQKREDDLFSEIETIAPRPTVVAEKRKTEEDFDRFWRVFPAGRKTDKPKAAAIFGQIVAGKHKLISKTDAEAIISGAERYAATNPDPQYVPIPKTWLNGARWEDVPAAPQSPHHGGHRLRQNWGEVLR